MKHLDSQVWIITYTFTKKKYYHLNFNIRDMDMKNISYYLLACLLLGSCSKIYERNR